jgi:hypothetical protein
MVRLTFWRYRLWPSQFALPDRCQLVENGLLTYGRDRHHPCAKFPTEQAAKISELSCSKFPSLTVVNESIEVFLSATGRISSILGGVRRVCRRDVQLRTTTNRKRKRTLKVHLSDMRCKTTTSCQ